MQPHKHAEVIKAWADGVPVQVKGVLAFRTGALALDQVWVDVDREVAKFSPWDLYRIKPTTTDEQTDDSTGIVEVSE